MRLELYCHRRLTLGVLSGSFSSNSLVVTFLAQPRPELVVVASEIAGNEFESSVRDGGFTLAVRPKTKSAWLHRGHFES